MSQLRIFSDTAFPSYRPKWRSDASGAGHGVVQVELMAFEREALNTALAWKKHDHGTLGDLVERIQSPVMTEGDETRMWDLIETWAMSGADDRPKARLAERIRRFAFSRHGRPRELRAETVRRAERACTRLQTQDPVIRHAWLFASHWIHLPVSDVVDGRVSYSEHEEKVRVLRIEAMKEIWASQGFEGVIGLLSNGAQAQSVGPSLAPNFETTNARADFLTKCLSVSGDMENAADGCMRALLQSIDGDALDAALMTVSGQIDKNAIVRLFACAPFRWSTWRLLDRHDREIRDRYWKQVDPPWAPRSVEALAEMMDRLLEVDRPRAAFHAVQHQLSRVKTLMLKRLLSASAAGTAEPFDQYLMDPNRISEAFQILDKRSGITPNEMVQLEFQYFEALDHSEHGVPNLEKQLAESPAAFLQFLAFAYKRSDKGEDPPEFRASDSKQREGLAQVAGRLLMRFRRLPGTGEDGEVNQQKLHDWVTGVRQLCAEYGRAEIGDLKIGELLSRASIASLSGEARSNARPSTASELTEDALARLCVSEEEIWPCKPICEVLEQIASKAIGDGFVIGELNSRGVVKRVREGGAQERELAARYRSLASRISFDYPYVSRVIESIADRYDAQADWEDGRARAEARLGYGGLD